MFALQIFHGLSFGLCAFWLLQASIILRRAPWPCDFDLWPFYHEMLPCTARLVIIPSIDYEFISIINAWMIVHSSLSWPRESTDSRRGKTTNKHFVFCCCCFKKNSTTSSHTFSLSRSSIYNTCELQAMPMYNGDIGADIVRHSRLSQQPFHRLFISVFQFLYDYHSD